MLNLNVAECKKMFTGTKKYRGMLLSPVYSEPTKDAWIGLAVDTCPVSSLGSRRSTGYGHHQTTSPCPRSSRTSKVLLPILVMWETGLVSSLENL